MTNCSSCGSAIRDGYQSCSMCYGDIAHGADDYYLEWARQQEERERARQDYYTEGQRLHDAEGK